MLREFKYYVLKNGQIFSSHNKIETCYQAANSLYKQLKRLRDPSLKHYSIYDATNKLVFDISDDFVSIINKIREKERKIRRVA